MLTRVLKFFLMYGFLWTFTSLMSEYKQCIATDLRILLENFKTGTHYKNLQNQKMLGENVVVSVPSLL